MTVLASRKLAVYAVLGAAGLLAAVAAGSPDLAVLALPFALVVGFGLAGARPPQLSVEVEPERERALIGETFAAEVRLASDRRLDVELAVPGRGLEVEGPSRVSLAAGREKELELEIACRRWGRYDLGRLDVRASDPLGLFVYRGRVGEPRELRVYPRLEPLAGVLSPRETQVLVGDFVAREKSDGHEFADIREWQPGDRVRRINWRTSTRTGVLHVNEYHPERNADLVLFLDAYNEIDTGAGSTLERTVRAAASIAEQHLKRRDRVGLVCYGGTLHWLNPTSGIHHYHRIVEALLDVAVYETPAGRDVAALPRSAFPSRAIVLALSPLLDERAIRALLDLRGSHLDLTVLELPVAGEPGGDELDRLADRLWRLQRRSVHATLAAAGIPVIRWRDDLSLAATIEEAREWRRHAYA